jgi:hypothetical protein
MYDSQIAYMTDLVTKALNMDLTDSKVDKIKKALQDYWADKIAITWSISDIASLDCAEGLSDADLHNILESLFDNLDCSVGITWETIETAVNEYKSRCNND